MMNALSFEFHISRHARDRYGFADSLFALSGNAVLANLPATREFARRMNQVRDAEHNPERTVHPGALNAMGLIDEALHAVMALYREQRDPQCVLDSLNWFEARLGPEQLHLVLLRFVEEFPSVEVYRGLRAPADWLADSTADVPHRAIALEEMIMLWLANRNPGFQPFQELFEDASLTQNTAYAQLTSGLRQYFEGRPRFGPENQNLIDMLRAPALASPDSLAGQLEFIRARWGSLLGDFFKRLLTAMDVLKEEEVAVWMRFHPPGVHFGGPQMLGDSSAAAIPSFSSALHEYERFSPDTDWMPNTVLIAKSVHVWLHQLSTFYRRSITRLDQIPDEELQRLARLGFNALWLIGVWERSRASRQIKQLTGNPEAAASAYSLYDYVIAADLGGEAAYQNLRERAWVRGLRLASDMVPNHMGIDSRWVIEHPDWFVSLPYSPFPVYRFNGPDLSSDHRVEIKIDDRYYDRSDAAVAFRRVDRWTGDTRYIYHGNDGTSFPWNDTAQLDYLKPEVREAVIQTILHVARQFPIIRFDAAMTLTKKHYQRLWFPEPGTGGAIPSRAEQGLTKAEFDASMPKEFWRELVDRVAAEVPGTLLLAEAFWLLEGYFVRTLGMHRVYNSAFMNMLRDEENANYRSVLKNTLEFDPEVLKRYVNFMNNPDERTAVDQFGKGDKYFGICTLMATLPGLPMFGHGQVEGFSERYGMEYRRAYQDEAPDPWMEARHEREIAPLLHRRALFAEVSEFLLYDFYTESGVVNEDVFAYSNRLGDHRALVVYHNRYAETRGWICTSTAYAEKDADGKQLRQCTLGESFGLLTDPRMFVAYRDALTGLEHLQKARDVVKKGMYLELAAYKCSVFLDWRDIREDGVRPWGELCQSLAGRGVPSLESALSELELKPVHDALRRLLDPALAETLARCAVAVSASLTSREGDAATARDRREANTPESAGGGHRTDDHRGEQQEVEGHACEEALAEAGRRVEALLEQTRHFVALRRGEAARFDLNGEMRGQTGSIAETVERRLHNALRIPRLEQYFSSPWPEQAHLVLPTVHTTLPQATAIWSSLLAWCALEALGSLYHPVNPEAAAVALFDFLHLRAPMAEAFAAAGLAGERRWQVAARVRASFAHVQWSSGLPHPAPGLVSGETVAAPFSWLHDADVAWLVGVNEHQGIRYFVKESYQRLLWWMALRRLLALAEAPTPDADAIRALELHLVGCMNKAAESQYRVESLLESAP